MLTNLMKDINILLNRNYDLDGFITLPPMERLKVLADLLTFVSPYFTFQDTEDFSTLVGDVFLALQEIQFNAFIPNDQLKIALQEGKPSYVIAILYWVLKNRPAVLELSYFAKYFSELSAESNVLDMFMSDSEEETLENVATTLGKINMEDNDH